MTTKHYIPKLWSAAKAIRKDICPYIRKGEWLKINELETALNNLEKLQQMIPKKIEENKL